VKSWKRQERYLALSRQHALDLRGKRVDMGLLADVKGPMPFARQTGSPQNLFVMTWVKFGRRLTEFS